MRAVALQQDWIVHADVDEEQEYPETLPVFLHKSAERGVNTITGVLRDRVHAYE